MQYILLCLIVSIPWVAFYALRKDLRKKMLLVSVAISPAGPLSELWYLDDYWKRETLFGWRVGIEDLVFAFMLSGVSFAAYKVIHKKHLLERLDGEPDYGAALIILTAVVTVHAAALRYTEINSVIVSSLLFFVIAIALLFSRRDLILQSVFSGVYVSAILFIAYQILDILEPGTLTEWCLHCNPTGIRVFRLNIEEVLWDFSWGALGGILYECLSRRTIEATHRDRKIT